MESDLLLFEYPLQLTFLILGRKLGKCSVTTRSCHYISSLHSTNKNVWVLSVVNKVFDILKIHRLERFLFCLLQIHFVAIIHSILTMPI